MVSRLSFSRENKTLRSHNAGHNNNFFSVLPRARGHRDLRPANLEPSGLTTCPRFTISGPSGQTTKQRKVGRWFYHLPKCCSEATRDLFGSRSVPKPIPEQLPNSCVLQHIIAHGPRTASEQLRTGIPEQLPNSCVLQCF